MIKNHKIIFIDKPEPSAAAGGFFILRLCYILVLILKDPFIGAKGGDSCGMKRAGRYTAGAKVTRRIGVRPAESVRP